MLTCIDEDEEGAEAAPKRAKVEEADAECDKNGDYSVNSFINNNIPSERLRYASQGETDSSSFSCGQASLFNELQNNVYHNLIASLET
jgi:hypothetical protein